MAQTNKKSNGGEDKKKDKGVSTNSSVVWKFRCGTIEVVKSIQNAEGSDVDKRSPKNDENKENAKGKGKKSEKEKEPPATRTILKLILHCDGCIDKISKLCRRTKGFQEIIFDKQNDLVTVIGDIDEKALTEKLKILLKRDVEVVLPKKKEKGLDHGKAKKVQQAQAPLLERDVEVALRKKKEKGRDHGKVNKAQKAQAQAPLLSEATVGYSQIPCSSYDVVPNYTPQVLSEECRLM